MTGVSLNQSKFLNFLSVIENLKCSKSILVLLSERLQEDGILGYKYKEIHRPFLKKPRRNLIEFYSSTYNNRLDDLFNREAQSELAQPSILKVEDLQDLFLLFPTYGPYLRSGLFGLHWPGLPHDCPEADVSFLGMILQKTYSIISVIEAQQEQNNLALTKREIDVLACLSSGLNNQQVANILEISVHTVNGYVSRIMLKLGTSNRLNTGLAGLSTPEVLSRTHVLIP